MKGFWRKLQTTGQVPFGRSSHSVTGCGGKVYVFGGEHKPRVPIGNEMHCLDLATNSWSECKVVGDVPVARNAHAAACVGNLIYIFGGRMGITMGEDSLNDLYAFDTVSNTWKRIDASGEVPCPRSYHTMTASGTKLYVFGGCATSGRLNDLYEFDTLNNTWKRLPKNDAIEGRGGPGLIVLDNNLFVVAGFAGREMNDVYKLDLSTQTWTTLKFQPDFPPRSVFGITAIGSKILLLFGEVDPSDLGHAGAGCFSNDCYIYDVSSGESWHKFEPDGDKPEPRGWMQVAKMKDDSGIIVFGGNNLQNERLNDTHLLEITL